MKGFILAKSETSNKQLNWKMNFFKDVFLAFWRKLQNSYFEKLISLAASVINVLRIL